jgi:hypothetical protein
VGDTKKLVRGERFVAVPNAGSPPVSNRITSETDLMPDGLWPGSFIAHKELASAAGLAAA